VAEGVSSIAKECVLRNRCPERILALEFTKRDCSTKKVAEHIENRRGVEHFLH
jgi:hypothetical protein